MNIKVLVSLAFFLPFSFAHATTLNCSGLQGSFIVSFDIEKNNLVFANTSAFGHAQIVAGEGLPLQVIANNKIYFEYDWYFTARYELTLDQSLDSVRPKKIVNLTLSGDDNDGTTFENEMFTCQAE